MAIYLGPYPSLCQKQSSNTLKFSYLCDATSSKVLFSSLDSAVTFPFSEIKFDAGLKIYHNCLNGQSMTGSPSFITCASIPPNNGNSKNLEQKI